MRGHIELVTNVWNSTVRMYARRSNGELEYVCEHKGNGHCEGHSACVSPDGRHAATAHKDESRVWSMESGECTATLSSYHGYAVCIDISNDHVVLACEYKAIRLYKHDGTPVRTLEGHSAWVCDVSFSPDGQQLVSGSEDNTACVWDVGAGTVRLVLRHPSSAFGVAWSPRSDSIATACADGNGRVWDATSGNLIATLTGHTDLVLCVTYSCDGARIATGSRNGIVQLWRGADWKQERVLRQPRGYRIDALSFSADGEWLASSGGDETVRIWDVEAGTCRQVLQHSDRTIGVVFRPIDRLAVERQREAMFAVAVVCDQRELPDGVYFPRELWSRCLDYVSWRDWCK